MRIRSRRRGVQILEFALILPVLLILVTGIFSFGWLFFNWLIIGNSARDGARYAAVGDSNTEIENLVIARSFFLNTDNVTITINPDTEADRVPGNPVTVAVSYQCPQIFPVWDVILPNPFPLAAAATFRVETGVPGA